MNNKRNTLQKQIVYQTFESMHNHPSAGMVYEAVHEKYPGISRATVYRLLAEAADEGRVLRLKLQDANDRFDVTLGTHYHIVCRECGSVADVKTDFDACGVCQTTVGCENFLVEQCHLEFLGLCEACRNRADSEANKS